MKVKGNNSMGGYAPINKFVSEALKDKTRLLGIYVIILNKIHSENMFDEESRAIFNNSCRISIRYFAREIALSCKTVIRSIKMLEELHIIKVIRRSGQKLEIFIVNYDEHTNRLSKKKRGREGIKNTVINNKILKEVKQKVEDDGGDGKNQKRIEELRKQKVELMEKNRRGLIIDGLDDYNKQMDRLDRKLDELRCG